MMIDGFFHQLPDIDPEETQEWLDSLESVVNERGKTRARLLIRAMLERAREMQVGYPATVSTPYVNTIPAAEQAWFPGDEYLEKRIRRFIRWNAAVMVVKANKAAGRDRRTPLDLRLVRRPVRGGIQPLLPGQGRRLGR